MMRDHYKIKALLNARRQREEEDRRINELESHYLPLWVYLLVAAVIAGVVSVLHA